jgi:aryl-alcohol dehydrogenase-like predicted oxidoreductase
MWIGEWMKKRNNRDEMVIATKFTTPYRAGKGNDEIIVNTAGNGTKSLHVSLEKSLKKLQTSYIDLVSCTEGDPVLKFPDVFSALRPLVGLHLLHSRADAVTEHCCKPRENPLPRSI